jgi:hypothetical protein
MAAMRRREFAVKFRQLGAVALLLTAGGLLPGCADEGEPADSTDFVYTTSIEAGHQHVLRVPKNLVETPPEGDLDLRTSTEAGHNHSVRVTVADLQTVRDGGTVDKTTATNDGHSHTLTLQRF